MYKPIKELHHRRLLQILKIKLAAVVNSKMVLHQQLRRKHRFDLGMRLRIKMQVPLSEVSNVFYRENLFAFLC